MFFIACLSPKNGMAKVNLFSFEYAVLRNSYQILFNRLNYLIFRSLHEDTSMSQAQENTDPRGIMTYSEPGRIQNQPQICSKQLRNRKE